MTKPEPLTFASAGPYGIHYARCWPCMTAQCPGGPHRWAGDDDIAHAVSIGKPDSADGPCACRCTTEPVRDESPDDDYDSDGDVSVYGGPCELCGEASACAYDSEGRPLIHAFDTSEDAP